MLNLAKTFFSPNFASKWVSDCAQSPSKSGSCFLDRWLFSILFVKRSNLLQNIKRSGSNAGCNLCRNLFRRLLTKTDDKDGHLAKIQFSSCKHQFMVRWLHSSWQDKTINLQENKTTADQAEDDASWENIFLFKVWQLYFSAHLYSPVSTGNGRVTESPNNQVQSLQVCLLHWVVPVTCPSFTVLSPLISYFFLFSCCTVQSFLTFLSHSKFFTPFQNPRYIISVSSLYHILMVSKMERCENWLHWHKVSNSDALRQTAADIFPATTFPQIGTLINTCLLWFQKEMSGTNQEWLQHNQILHLLYFQEPWMATDEKICLECW